jgi:hypothetical protein
MGVNMSEADEVKERMKQLLSKYSYAPTLMRIASPKPAKVTQSKPKLKLKPKERSHERSRSTRD